jgi:CheY-like chemotaxis protein
MTKINTLYIVDDDETYQFILKRIVSENCSVKEVKGFLNGRQAIDGLSASIGKPDQIPELILLDLTMPVMDGWQFLEHYISLQPRIKKKIEIYIASSSVNPQDVERARAIEQVTDYVVKPITREKFADILRRMAA